MKEIKENTNKWKDIPWSWIRRVNIVKMPILPTPKPSIDSIIPMKIPMAFFTDIEKRILQFI